MWLLMPLGVIESTLMTVFWTTSLWLTFLPVYWSLVPADGIQCGGITALRDRLDVVAWQILRD